MVFKGIQVVFSQAFRLFRVIRLMRMIKVDHCLCPMQIYVSMLIICEDGLRMSRMSSDTQFELLTLK
jgi:hypothetical protein